jgi:ribosomal protein S18 acetylase RimI-like enzyme
MNNLIIKEASVDDIDEIHRLGEDVQEFDTTEEVVTFWPKHILKNCIDSKSDWILVARLDRKIVGFIICNNSPVFKKAVIENIYVEPKYRRNGIGKELLKALQKKISSTDCEYVVVFTEDDNDTSIGFYTSQGFNRGKNFAWIDKVLSKEFSKK